MRRRPKSAVAGVPVQDAVIDFIPEQWPGANEWEKYEAWCTERTRWAEANLPNGVADLPSRIGAYVPDMPWDGSGI